MTKGRFGLSFSAIAVIAFSFAALRQPTAVLLVTGFALLAEKDEWLNKQALQALLLTLTYYIIDMASNWLLGGLARLFSWVKLYGTSSVMLTINSVIGDLLFLALAVVSVIAILRVLNGKDANLPWLAKLADGDLTEALKRRATKPVNVAPPAQYSQYTPPQRQAASVSPAPAPMPPTPARTTPIPPTPVTSASMPTKTEAQTPSVLLCPSCSASLQSDSIFCTECGTKIK